MDRAAIGDGVPVALHAQTGHVAPVAVPMAREKCCRFDLSAFKQRLSSWRDDRHPEREKRFG